MLGIPLGILFIIPSLKAIKDKKIMFKRATADRNGKTIPATYWEGTKAVVAGWICFLFGILFILGGLASL